MSEKSAAAQGSAHDRNHHHAQVTHDLDEAEVIGPREHAEEQVEQLILGQPDRPLALGPIARRDEAGPARARERQAAGEAVLLGQATVELLDPVRGSALADCSASEQRARPGPRRRAQQDVQSAASRQRETILAVERRRARPQRKRPRRVAAQQKAAVSPARHDSKSWSCKSNTAQTNNARSLWRLGQLAALLHDLRVGATELGRDVALVDDRRAERRMSCVDQRRSLVPSYARRDRGCPG